MPLQNSSARPAGGKELLMEGLVMHEKSNAVYSLDCSQECRLGYIIQKRMENCQRGLGACGEVGVAVSIALKSTVMMALKTALSRG